MDIALFSNVPSAHPVTEEAATLPILHLPFHQDFLNSSRCHSS